MSNTVDGFGWKRCYVMDDYWNWLDYYWSGGVVSDDWSDGGGVMMNDWDGSWMDYWDNSGVSNWYSVVNNWGILIFVIFLTETLKFTYTSKFMMNTIIIIYFSMSFS